VSLALSWVAKGGIDFCGPTVDFGPITGGAVPVGYRYQRWCFNGFNVALFRSGDQVTWYSVFGAGLGPSTLTGWLALAQLVYDNWLLQLANPPYSEQPGPLSPVLLSREGFVRTMDAVNGNVLKLVVEMEQFGEPLQIEHYFRRTNDATVDPGSDISLVGDFTSGPRDALLACMDVSVAIKRYRAEWRVQGANAILPRTYLVASAPGQVGTANEGAPGADASQLAYVISWYTNFAGRGERGRTFIPGTSHDFIVANRVVEDGTVALQAYADSLMATFGGDEDSLDAWQLVLWRQHLTNPALVPGDDGEYANPLNTAVPPSVAEWPGHDEEGKPIYTFPPTTRPPFSPAAAQHGITLAVPSDKLRTQRRRGPGVRISRGGHRTV
jgi:hypothetical protein